MEPLDDLSPVTRCSGIFKTFTTFIMTFVLSMISFFGAGMVHTEKDIDWGLYIWCNTTDASDDNCHFIHAGDSPAYFEVARFCATVSLPLGVASLWMMMFSIVDRRSATARGFIKLAIKGLPSLNVAIVLFLVGTQYKYDDRWKDFNPALHTSFWIITGTAALDFPFTCVYVFFTMDDFVRIMLHNRRRNKLRRSIHRIQGVDQHSREDAVSNRDQAEPKGIANVKARVVWMRTFLAILIHRLKSQGPGAVTKHEVTHQRKEEPEISGNGDISNHNPVADPAADVVSSEVFSTTNHQLSRVDVHCLPDSMTGRFVFQLRRPEHLCSESSI